MKTFFPLNRKEQGLLTIMLKYLPPNIEFDFDFYSPPQISIPRHLKRFLDKEPYAFENIILFLTTEAFVVKIENEYKFTDKGLSLWKAGSYQKFVWKSGLNTLVSAPLSTFLLTILTISISIRQCSINDKAKTLENKIEQQQQLIDSIKHKINKKEYRSVF